MKLKIKSINPIRLSLLLIICCFSQGFATEFFVSPRGSDSNTGSEASPFATMERAHDAVRDVIARGLTENITVYLRGGTYRIAEPLIFDYRDSGTGEFSITYAAYPGEKPVISGGRIITGWQQNMDGTWRTTIDQVKTGAWLFRELFVNGRRAVRARHPNAGYLRVVKAGEDRMSSFFFNRGDIPPQAAADNTELVFIHDWSISRIPVAGIDHANRILFPAAKIGRQHSMMVIDGYEPHPRYFLENDPACCDAPGEWCLLPSGEIIYLPQEGETIEQTDFIAPVAEQLLVVRGDSIRNRPVQNLHFKCLIFEHCAFNLPAEGYAGVQATFHPAGSNEPGFERGWRNYITPAIDFEMAANCSFRDGTIRHLGGSGIRFGSRCKDCVLDGTILSDISGNGVMIGESTSRFVAGQSWWQSAPDQVASQNIVSNCLVENCGVQFYGAVGIWVGLAQKTVITHNEIRYLPYTGVSVGWMWNPKPTPCKENIISNNHIHHVMQILSDGAAVYTLG